MICKIPNFDMWTASFLYWVDYDYIALDFTNLWVFFSELVPAGFLAASLCFFKKSIVAKSTVVLSIFLWAAAAAAAAAAELPEVWPPPSSEAWVRILCFISALRQSNWHLCAQVVSWFEFQLDFSLFWNCKLQNCPNNLGLNHNQYTGSPLLTRFSNNTVF